jgi:cysteine desulfurase
MSYVKSLRDMLIDRIFSSIPDVRLNGHKTDRLPGNVSVSFAGIESETLLILLDRENICASGGSACSTGALEPSHVLKAIGLDDELSSGTVRFSLSYTNTESEIDTVVRILSEKVGYLRKQLIR